MGRKSKLSNMMPHAWFYKLRHAAVVHSGQQKHQFSHSSSPSSSSAISQLSSSRKSYHFASQVDDGNEYYDFPFTGKFSDSSPPETPRKSSKLRRRRRIVARSPAKHIHSSISTESVRSKSETPPEFSSSPFDSSTDGDFRTDAVLATESFDRVVSRAASKSKSCACKTKFKDNDIIIDIDKDSLMIDFNSSPELELAPIRTKPATFSDMISGIKKEKIVAKEQTGLKLRVNSPRIGRRKSVYSSSTAAASSGRICDGLAVVKSSLDPRRDFRESMVEMIVENNIKASKDMEDLLARYLSLNADEYHDLIIEVFKQVLLDLLINSQIEK